MFQNMNVQQHTTVFRTRPETTQVVVVGFVVVINYIRKNQKKDMAEFRLHWNQFFFLILECDPPQKDYET